MTERQKLLQLVERLPDQDIPVAQRVLAALADTSALSDSLADSLALAPYDDEPDDDDSDGGLAEARQQAEAGDVVSMADAERLLGLT